MPEQGPISEQEKESTSPEKRIFSLHGRYGRLSGDLANVGHSLLAVLNGYKEGRYSEEEVRDKLSNARTFEEYFKGQLKKYNEAMEEGSQLYDEEASLEAELKIIDNPDLVQEFDKKVLKLRKLAGKKKIDKEKIEKIIHEEIDPLIYGKEE